MRKVIWTLLALLVTAAPCLAKTLMVAGRISSEMTVSQQVTFGVSEQLSELVYRFPVPAGIQVPSISQRLTDHNITFEPEPESVKDETDAYGNLYKVVTWRKLSGDARANIVYTAALDAVLDRVTFRASFPMMAVPESERLYLKPTKQVQSADGRIVATAAELTAGLETESAAVDAILNFVTDHIRYESPPKSYDALYGFTSGTGNCQNFAHLACALLRASGIPARVAVGLTLKDKWKIPLDNNGSSLVQGMGEGLHAWIEVWFPGLGWLPCDPQQSKQFTSTRHIKYAHGPECSGIGTTWKAAPVLPRYSTVLSSTFSRDSIKLSLKGSGSEPHGYMASFEMIESAPLVASPPVVAPAPLPPVLPVPVIQPQPDPEIERQLAQRKLSEQKLAEQRLAEQRLAEQRLAEQKLAAQKLAEQKLADKRLAEQKLAEQKLAEQKLAEQKIAELKLAEQKLAEQKRIERKQAELKLAEQKMAELKLAEQKLAERKLAAQKLAESKLAERKLAEQKRAEQKLAERKLAEQKLAERKLAEQKLAEQKRAKRKLAEQKLAERKLAEQKQAEQKRALRKLAEKKLADEKLAATVLAEEKRAERKLAEQKLAEQRLASEQKMAELKLIDQALSEQKLAELKLVEQKLAELKVAEQKLAEQKLAEQKLAEQKLAEQKLAEQKLADEKLAEQKLAEQRLAEHKLAEQKLAEEKLAEQKLAEQRLAEQKLAEQKLAEEKLAEQKLAEQRLAEQKLAEQLAEQKRAEQKLAEQKLAEQKLAEQKLVEQRQAELKLAEQKMAELKLAEQKLAEQKLVEQRLAEQRLAEQKLAEQRLAEQRLAEQRLAEQKLAEQRLIEQRLAERRLAEQRLAKLKLPVKPPKKSVEPPPLKPDKDGMIVFGNMRFPATLSLYTNSGDRGEASLEQETAEYATSSSVYAQAFILDRPLRLEKVSLATKKFGGDGTVYLDIVADENGKPGLTNGVRSQPVYLENVRRTPGYGWLDFNIPADTEPFKPGKYWVVLRRSGEAILNWYYTPGKSYGGSDDTRSTARGWQWEDILTYDFVFKVAGREAR